MATNNTTERKNTNRSFIYTRSNNPRTLQSFCSEMINNHPELSSALYHYGPYWSFGYKYSFEKVVDEIRRTVNNRHMLNEKSFERWFRKYINEKMDSIMMNKKNLKYILKVAKGVHAKLLSFKCLYGVAREVFYDIILLIMDMEELKL